MLCVRPEFIKTEATGAAGGRNLFRGKIETLLFVGEAYEGEIRIGNTRITRRFPRPSMPSKEPIFSSPSIPITVSFCPHRGAMSRKSALTPALIVIVGILTVSPVLMLVAGSFSEGFGTFHGFTVAKYVEAYTDPELSAVLLDTSIFTLGSAAVATLLALFLAYVNTRTNIPFKFFFGIISVIPMMIPHILFAVSWVLLLNPSQRHDQPVPEAGLRTGEGALNIYSISGDDPRRGAAGPAHRLPGHRPRHERLRRFARGILQGLRGEHLAHALPGDACRSCVPPSWPRRSSSSSEPRLLRRALGHRHAGKDLRAGHPHLPRSSPPDTPPTTGWRPRWG